MNNLRLLTGVLAVLLSGGGVCAYGQSVYTLEEIFEAAEANSAQLRPAITASAEARAAVSEARTRRLPDIDASLNLSYIGDGFITARDLSGYQRAPIPHFGSGLGVEVTQPVYTGGAISNSITLAKQKSTAARLAEELNRDNIRLRLTGFYLDLYKYSNLRSIVDANISAAQKVLADMRLRYEQGTALRNDITRYELLVSNLELELIRIDNTIRILNDNLVTVAGLPSETIVVPDTTILDRSLPGRSEEWWQQTATEHSPSLSLARTGVDISRTAEALVRSERLPKIGLKAAWTIDGPILVEIPPINRNLSYWYVGVGVSYNLASLYKNGKSLAKSRLATRKSVEELDAARDNLSLSVRADHIRYLEAHEELKTRTKSVELADRNYTTTSTRYMEGMALITDMLDAANSKLDAEQQLVNARINLVYTYYKLLFTTGTI